MALAVEESRKGYPAPNPHVGCVIVRDGVLLGKGHHQYAGGPHAEINALNDCSVSPKGSTVYVTQEPCNHFGRTGPCSKALIAAGVAKVVMAVHDPNPIGSGGADTLISAGIEVETGLMATEAETVNEVWLTAVRRQRPYVIVKAGVSADGCISLKDGRSQWITSEESRRQAHQLRAEMGSVLVGRGTAEVDNPRLTLRGFEVVNQPLRIVLDSKRRLKNDLNLFDGSAPTLRVVSSAPLEHEVQVELVDGEFPLKELLSVIYDRGVRGILVEGGRTTISRFVEQDLVDRIELFVSPKLLGSSESWLESDLLQVKDNPLNSDPRWMFSNVRAAGSDIHLTMRPNR